MSVISVFDVLGPCMIGPSSSHTAGPVAIANLARQMVHGPVQSVEFTLYASFARTYRGHGTDRALLGGILGYGPDDARIRDAFAYAKEQGLDYRFLFDESDPDIHPNTVDIRMTDAEGRVTSVRGESLGGGKVRITRINGIEVDCSGQYCTLVIIQRDKPGVVAHITSCLAARKINIAYMRMYREVRGSTAYTIVESDESIPDDITEEICRNPNVHDVMVVQPAQGG